MLPAFSGFRAQLERHRENVHHEKVSVSLCAPIFPGRLKTGQAFVLEEAGLAGFPFLSRERAAVFSVLMAGVCGRMRFPDVPVKDCQFKRKERFDRLPFRMARKGEKRERVSGG